MKNRGYNVSEEWFDKNYRGKICVPHNNLKECKINKPIYKEHDAAYYDECIENLAQKDIFIQLYKYSNQKEYCGNIWQIKQN